MTRYPITYKPVAPTSRLDTQGRMIKTANFKPFRNLLKKYKYLSFFYGNRYKNFQTAMFLFLPNNPNVEIDLDIIINDTKKLIYYVDRLEKVKNFWIIDARRYKKFYVATVISKETMPHIITSHDKIPSIISSEVHRKSIEELIEFANSKINLMHKRYHQDPILVKISTSLKRHIEITDEIDTNNIPSNKIIIVKHPIENFKVVASKAEQKNSIIISAKD